MPAANFGKIRATSGKVPKDSMTFVATRETIGSPRELPPWGERKSGKRRNFPDDDRIVNNRAWRESPEDFLRRKIPAETKGGGSQSFSWTEIALLALDWRDVSFTSNFPARIEITF